jgi:alpha-tubulin suppressor-like RCC1 family protein
MPQWKQYSGIWTSTQQAQAVAAGTWTGLVFNEFYTWGSNGNGQLGENAVGSLSRSSPTQVGGKDNWDKIVGSGRSSTFFAVKDNGTLWSWGLNSFTIWSTVAGGNTKVAVRTDGRMFSWGNNGDGQLGQNVSTVTDRSSPVQIGSLTSWVKAVSTEDLAFAAIRSDGRLYAWGKGDNGQLGVNSTISYSSPVQIGALTTWANIFGVGKGFFALKTDGTLWTWGDNSYSQRGNGNSNDLSSPVQIGALTTWTKVSGSWAASIGMTSDGKAYTWGRGTEGETGQNTTSTIESPVQLGTETDWTEVFGGGGALTWFTGGVREEKSLT